MGTHPIFESDFDRLTEHESSPRPVSQLRTQVRHSHVFDGETLSVLKKISYFLLPPCLLVTWINQDVRHPSLVLRPAMNQAPWNNMQDAKMPFDQSGKKSAFFDDAFNIYAGKGYADGNNEGVICPCHEHH